MKDFYFDESYRQGQSLLTKLSWERGDYDFRRKSVVRVCARQGCGNSFKTIPSDPKRFCSQSCSGRVNNIGRVLSEITKAKISKANTITGRYVRKNKLCLHCNSFLGRHQLKYCSLKCQSNYNYQAWLESWRSGTHHGGIGVLTKSISGYLRRYIHEKFEDKCVKCGWGETHPITNRVMLEIEHIDGNSENNKESNLTLLCPNCHSLTPFYKNLNKGKGRKWRMDKYIRNS